jgi:hypothetical protein
VDLDHGAGQTAAGRIALAGHRTGGYRIYCGTLILALAGAVEMAQATQMIPLKKAGEMPLQLRSD